MHPRAFVSSWRQARAEAEGILKQLASQRPCARAVSRGATLTDVTWPLFPPPPSASPEVAIRWDHRISGVRVESSGAKGTRVWPLLNSHAFWPVSIGQDVSRRQTRNLFEKRVPSSLLYAGEFKFAGSGSSKHHAEACTSDTGSCSSVAAAVVFRSMQLPCVHGAIKAR